MDERVALHELLKDGEELYAEMVPDKFCYCLLPVLRLLPIAIVWGCFDIGFIIMLISSNNMTSMMWFLIPFFAIHLFPCYQVFIIYGKRRIEWKNTRYGITSHRILRMGGALGVEVQSIDYHEVDHVDIKMSWIEKMRHVGTISITSDSGNIDFVSITHPVKYYKMLTKTSFDVKSDIEYPNALRPDGNPGYKTKYDSKSEYHEV